MMKLFILKLVALNALLGMVHSRDVKGNASMIVSLDGLNHFYVFKTPLCNSF
jgi:hypothetical protein